MYESQITVQGNVATDVRHLVTDAGVHLAKFRVAATRRRFVRATGEWVDAGTSFYSVTAWKFLAQNAAASLRKGDPVFIVGSLRVRDWTSDDGRSGTSADIDADALGHDLNRGVATFQRVTRTREIERPADDASRALGARPPVAGEESPQVEWDEETEGIESAAAGFSVPPGVDPVTGELIAEGAAA